MRKVFILITLLFGYSSYSLLEARAETQNDPNISELNKSSQYTGSWHNIWYLYNSDPVNAKKIKLSDKFLSHDFIVPINNPGHYDYVKTELKDSTMASSFDGKEVDIFGVDYFDQCYFSNENIQCDSNQGAGSKKTCMYGGITLNENNTNNRIQPIVVKVYENDSVTLSFDINIDKETVTIQELDYKVRNKLISKINLYHLGGTSYETGYIKFIENGNRYYWYDMMPDPGFTQSKYLMIYRGNETVESAKTEIEVHLTKK